MQTTSSRYILQVEHELILDFKHVILFDVDSTEIKWSRRERSVLVLKILYKTGTRKALK